MKTMYKFFLMMVVVLMGSMMTTSCGDDDDDSGSTVSDYALYTRISDPGNLPSDAVELLNSGLTQYTVAWKNITLDLAKKALDQAIDQMDTSDLDPEYSYAIEYYIMDTKANKKVYSRTVTIKNGKVTKS